MAARVSVWPFEDTARGTSEARNRNRHRFRSQKRCPTGAIRSVLPVAVLNLLDLVAQARRLFIVLATDGLL